MKILFTGGGSGGHFFPIVAVIRELKRIAEAEQILDLELFYIGPDEFGKEILQGEEVELIVVPTGKFRRYFSLINIVDFFKTVLGVLRGIWNIFLIMPDVAFSKGGYGSLPAVIGAIIFQIPLIIHESDSIPGKITLFASRFAKRIAVSFPAALDYFPKEKTAITGVPVRKRILGGSKTEAKENLDIFSNLPVVAFLGASQGAEKINQAVLGALKELTQEFEIIHQTGEAHLQAIKEEAGVILEFAHKEHYHAFGFLDEIGVRDFYQAADLIVSRAGATNIFEIAAWGKPSILIPLSHAAQNHQRQNAYTYADTGAAMVLEETNLTPHVLLAEIKKIISDANRMQKMSQAAQGFTRIDAAELIAREILQLGNH